MNLSESRDICYILEGARLVSFFMEILVENNS